MTISAYDIPRTYCEGSVNQLLVPIIEQTYSASQKSLPMSEFFINQLRKELWHIRELYPQDPLDAYMRFRSLILMLPSALKDEPQSVIEPADEKMKQECEPTQVFHDSYSRFVGSVTIPQSGDTYKQVPYRLVEDLIAKFSTSLHEEFERLQTAEKAG